MNIIQLREELASVNTLVLDGVITVERGEVWKNRIIQMYEESQYPPMQTPPPKPNKIPDDVAHIPGRMVAGIIGALKQINPERCAGVAPEQKVIGVQPQNVYKSQLTRSKPREKIPSMDDLPDMYK